MSDSKIHVHVLCGCSPTPLAHYLKALGILRLVSEQTDSTARGWWTNDAFHLATILNREELEKFFLEKYAPTPMTAPWNGGSGFYPKDNKTGIEPIELSKAKRFEPFREAISIARNVVSHLEKKPNKGSEKNEIISQCRLAWRGGANFWIDSALTIGADGEPAFPALLGTGGNDGRLDFTTNLMQRIASMFEMSDSNGRPKCTSIQQLDVALWGNTSATLETGAIGQFFPCAAGGPNGSTGFDGGVRVNPWDYILMLEGAILFRSGLSRKCSSQPLPQAAAPFAFRASGSGYGSSDSADTGSRGEQWMPIWNRPSTLNEITNILREGRSRIDGKAAERGTDMARAVSRMGVARGITSFERFGYIERNGLANLAIPLGRFEVATVKNQEILDEIAPFLDRLRRLAGAKNAPRSFDRILHACEEAMIATTRSYDSSSFLSLLITLGQAEDQMVRSPKFSADNYATPMPSLSHKWVRVISENENSAEFRLALALALQHGPLASNDYSHPIRIHWVPLEGKYFEKGEGGLRVGPEQCAVGLDLESSLISVINRRLIAMQNGAAERNRDNQSRLLPLFLRNKAMSVRLEDIEAFLEYRVNDGRILAIARGLMSINLKGLRSNSNEISEERCPPGGLATYGLFRLAIPTRPIWLSQQVEKHVRCNSAVYRRLQTGNFPAAVSLARRQLAAAGLRSRISVAIGSRRFAKRIAAAMAFGISSSTFTRLAFGLTDPKLDPVNQDEMVTNANEKQIH